MTKRKSLFSDPEMAFIISFITVTGASVRLFAPIFSTAPLNDGGLFYTMTLDILRSGLKIPYYTTYNSASIPYLYPPLALYATGLIAQIFKVDTFELFRILPAVLSTLTIPAFYLLAKEVLNSKVQVALSVTVFAFIPRAFDWHIMGGGITRAPGFIFAILAIRWFYRYYRDKQYKKFFGIVVLSSLAIFTHPEAPVQIAIAALVFYLVLDRSIRGMVYSFLVVLGITLMTSPWWTLMLSHHGISAFLAPISAASQDSSGLAARLFTFFGFEFTDELFLQLIAVLALIGIAVTIAHKQYFYIAWMAAAYLVEPRSGALYLILPHAMLASIAIEQVILPGLRLNSMRDKASDNKKEQDESWANQLLNGRIAKLVIGYIFVYGMLSASAAAMEVNRNYTLKSQDLEVFKWIEDNTSADSRFILITNEVPLRDPTSEWFPSLTHRQSLGTVFGYEWVNDGVFSERTSAYKALQLCSSLGEQCLSEWSMQRGIPFDFVYIRKLSGNKPIQIALIKDLQDSDKYKTILDTKNVIIFQAIQ